MPCKVARFPAKLQKLNGVQLQKINLLVVGVDPRQLKFEIARCTRAMICELIWREFRVKLSAVSVGRMLKKLGLSPQRPTHRAIQRDDLSAYKWMVEDYPAIRKVAKQQKVEVYFGDESTVRSDYHSGTTWSPIGKTPIVKASASRHKVSLISAISPRGAMRFMTTEGSVTSSVFVAFLKRVLHKANRPVFLIVDNHSVHRSRGFHEIKDCKNGKLCLFSLPP